MNAVPESVKPKVHSMPEAYAVLDRDWGCYHWIVAECPLCHSMHSHGGGLLENDPHRQLGHRLPHCSSASGFSGAPGYILVEAEGAEALRMSKILKKECPHLQLLPKGEVIASEAPDNPAAQANTQSAAVMDTTGSEHAAEEKPAMKNGNKSPGKPGTAVKCCAHCAFYAPIPRSEPDKTEFAGQCRIHPPRGGKQNFPVIDRRDWCGRFKAVEPSDKSEAE